MAENHELSVLLKYLGRGKVIHRVKKYVYRKKILSMIISIVEKDFGKETNYGSKGREVQKVSTVDPRTGKERKKKELR